MLKLYTKVSTWLAGDEGATALEYGILVAVIALAILIGAGNFGTALSDFFDGIAAKVPF